MRNLTTTEKLNEAISALRSIASEECVCYGGTGAFIFIEDDDTESCPACVASEVLGKLQESVS